MVKAKISSNQWFGALNRRFDRRARLLRRLGYKYTRSPLGAVFVRGSGFRLESISASVVGSAHNRDFVEAVRCPVCVRLDEFEGLAARLQGVASGSRVNP
jgi:hypothetical protein